MTSSIGSALTQIAIPAAYTAAKTLADNTATTTKTSSGTNASDTVSISKEAKSFLGKVTDAIEGNDVSALVTAIGKAAIGESSVYGAAGLILGTAIGAGFDILTGNSSDSSSSSDNTFTSTTPDAIKARINTSA